MKAFKIFLKADAVVLTVISIISFVTHNVADAIFYMVVAIYIEQGLERWEE